MQTKYIPAFATFPKIFILLKMLLDASIEVEMIKARNFNEGKAKVSSLLFVISLMGAIVMMVLKIHIRESFQQFLPVILTFLPVALVFRSSFFKLSSIRVPPIVVPSVFIQSSTFFVPPLFQSPFVPVFFWKLRLVERFCSWTEVIM